MADYVNGALASAAYAGVGVLLMGLGFALIDVLTPGRLGRQIWHERNPNAAVVLSSGLAGTALVIVVAILTSGDDLAEGLLSTAVYGLIGLVLMGLSFVVLDAVTPGSLGATLTEPTLHPAAWVTATIHLSIGAVVAAAIS